MSPRTILADIRELTVLLDNAPPEGRDADLLALVRELLRLLTMGDEPRLRA